MSPQNSPQTPQDAQKPDTPFQANIVTNIPIHAAGGPAVPAGPQKHQDTDKIMRDVGDQLKKEDIHKPKRHFWNRKPDTSQPSKFSAQPVPKDLAQPRPLPAQNASQPTPQAPAATHQPQTAAKPQPMPKPKSSVPVLTIVVTLIVTGGLIALAVVSLG